MAESPTIRDVARAAKVAVGSVSRVLNGHKSVSDDVRSRVFKAVEKLKYEPDRVAQSMRLRVTKTIACATRDISIPGFGNIVKAAEEALRDDGYTLFLAHTDERKEREIELLRAFMRRRVDAIIMTTSSEDDVDVCRQIESFDIPVVLLDRDVPASLDSVLIDHYRGTRAAAEYLISLGHTHVALLTGRSTLRPGRERIRGFTEAATQLGKRKSNFIVRSQSFSKESAFSEASSLLSSSSRPTAIIAGGMAMLPGVLQAVRAHGLRIPDDISIIAGSDTDLAALATPAITAVRWSEANEGRLAVELLLSRLKGERRREASRIMLPTELITRGSCAAPLARRS
jgi:LacI family transcriptional regulator